MLTASRAVSLISSRPYHILQYPTHQRLYSPPPSTPSSSELPLSLEKTCSQHSRLLQALFLSLLQPSLLQPIPSQFRGCLQPPLSQFRGCPHPPLHQFRGCHYLPLPPIATSPETLANAGANRRPELLPPRPSPPTPAHARCPGILPTRGPVAASAPPHAPLVLQPPAILPTRPAPSSTKLCQRPIYPFSPPPTLPTPSLIPSLAPLLNTNTSRLDPIAPNGSKVLPMKSAVSHKALSQT
jgi:hypothetical protein